MSQDFTKGLTHNHLTWVMVDATDFASPESALSGAIKIYIYGKLQSTSLVYFVSSGTGSLTGGDIKHVGASKFGAYTVNLVKADLSDASAAWYDQYVFHMSATGAAHQTLIVDGGIFRSFMSQTASDILSTAGSQFAVISNYLSNASNYLSSISAIASDAHSAAILGASTASTAGTDATAAASRVLLVQSRLSDFMSAIYPSDISDIRSMLTGMSDILSQIIGDTVYISGIVSGLGAGQTASAIADKVWSDYGSKVGVTPSQSYSVINLMGSRVSEILADTVYISNIVSGLGTGASASAIAAKVWSDYQSKVGQSPSQVYSNTSNYLSYISGVVSGLGAGQSASAIAAKVWSDYGSKVGATPSKVFSYTSNYLSSISAIVSNAHSAALAAQSLASVAANLSDALSDTLVAANQINSRVLLVQSRVSDILIDTAGLNGADASDIASATWAHAKATSVLAYGASAAEEASNAASAATILLSRVPTPATTASDLVSRIWSDFESKMGVSPSQLYSVVLLAASRTSEILADTVYISGVVSGLGAGQSASAIAAKVWSDYGSRVGVTPSQAYSYISNMLSSISAISSDAHSAALVAQSYASVAANLSDALSDTLVAANQTNSRVLLVQSRLSELDSRASSDMSDILSAVRGNSDVLSQILVDTVYISGVVSGIGAGQSASAIAAAVWSDYGSKVGQTPSQVYSYTSNMLSYISGVVSGLGAGQSASAIAAAVWSDYGSKVGATPSQQYSVINLMGSRVSEILADTVYISGIVSALGAPPTASKISSKVWSDYGSRVGQTPSQVYSNTSDTLSKVLANTAGLAGADASDIASATWAHAKGTSTLAYGAIAASAASTATVEAAQANSRVLLVQSRFSDFTSAVYPSDISDIRSMLTALSGMLSDVDSAVSSQYSDLLSTVGNRYTSTISAIGAVSVALTASDISDLASQVIVGISGVVLDVNVVQVNEITVSGVGTVGNPWGPG